MKHRNRIFVVLLLLETFICFGSAKSITPDTDETDIKEPLQEQVSKNPSALSAVEKWCSIYDYLETLDDFLLLNVSYNFDLTIIIADDVQNAITLAKYLGAERINGGEKGKILSDAEQLVHNEVISNIYFYTATLGQINIGRILIYPSDLNDDLVRNYVMKIVANKARRITFLLTHQGKISRDAVDPMLQNYINCFANLDELKPNISIDNTFFFPLSITETCKLSTTINNYFEKFARFGKFSNLGTMVSSIKDSSSLSKEERQEVRLIEMFPFSERPLRTLTCTENHPSDQIQESYKDNIFTNFYLTLIKYNPSVSLYTNIIDLIPKGYLKYTTVDNTMKCLEKKISTIEDSNLDGSFFNMSTLTGLLTFIDYLESTCSKLYSLLDEGSIENICSNIQNSTILQLLCRMKEYLPNWTSNNSNIWIEKIKLYVQDFLQNKYRWFMKLKTLYDNEKNWNETEIANELQNLYNKIPEIKRYNRKLMENAISTVKNKSFKIEWLVSCSLIKNGYKLQVKGKFIKLSEVLKSENHCPGKVKFIELFALERIIIDEDLIKDGEKLQVNIIAPIWEVVSKRTINLDGVSGKIITKTWKTGTLDFPMDDLTHDVPGLSGGSGGIFFGLMEKSVDGSNLNISCDGGKGGIGKYGEGVYGGLQKCIKFYRDGEGGAHGEAKLFSLNNSPTQDIKLSFENGIPGTKRFKICNYIDNKDSPGDYGQISHQEPKKSTDGEDFGEATKRYRKYIISSILESDNSRDRYSHLYFQLSNNTNIPNVYNTSDLIEEITDLERYYSKTSNKSDLSYLFTVWKNGLDQHKKKLPASEQTEVLSELEEMVSQQNENLKRNFYNNSIHIQIEYLETCIEESEKLLNAGILTKLQSITDDYKSSFDKEIKEADSLIHGTLYEEIEKKLDEFKDQNEKLLDEINTLIETKKVLSKELEEKIGELNNTIKLRIIFGVIKVVFILAAVVNPACAIIFGLMLSGVSIAESLTFDSSGGTSTGSIKLPAGVLAHSMKMYEKKQQDEVKLVEGQLTKMQEKMDGLRKQGEDIEPLIKAEENIRNKCTGKSARKSGGSKCALEILKKEQTQLIIKEAKLKKQYNAVSDKKSLMKKSQESSLKVINTAMVGLDATQSAIETGIQVRKDFSEKDKLNAMLERNKDEIKKLVEFKDNVHEFVELRTQEIRDKLSNETEGFGASSITYLDFKKWQIDDYLQQMMSEMRSSIKGFEVEREVEGTMEKLNKVINKIIDLHILVKKYHLKMTTAEYMKDIVSLQFQLTNINDPKLKEAANKFYHIYYANDVLDSYNEWKTSFMQYTFPFTSDFPINFPLITVFNDPTIKANIAVRKMKSVKAELIKRKSKRRRFPKTTPKQFGTEDLSPFYVWENRTYSSDIQRILEGKTVNLFANIFDKTDYNAVKFRDIKILFTPVDFEDNDTIEKDFHKFTVELTHNGNSYYRCDEKVYLIQSGAFEVGERDNIAGKKKRSTDEYDYVLSPYANWTIRLQNYENADFKSLLKYVNKVNMELVGDGQLTHKNLNACKNDLTKYYGEEVTSIL